MNIKPEQVREHLRQYRFQPLFVEELGWDNHYTQPFSLVIDGKTYTLKAVAEKKGMVVYECSSDTDGMIPDHTVRRKVDREVTKFALEHLIVYTDRAKTEQVWQWVRREPGKPTASREHHFHTSQSGEALIQKLEVIAIPFEEEEQLTLVGVTSRARKAFDIDKVTKRFYERFKKEHEQFLKFIEGLRSQFDRDWYGSLMLNRLMFVYFIQKKGFLDGNTNYLRDRLRECQRVQGQGKFISFYRYFLRRLFHEGLDLPPSKRDAELNQLLGKVPYLNGGLFEIHELEKNNPDLQIPDGAFERIFNFFDEWDWCLDDRPLSNDREINPDVLGYIFEKYINQKQMGAYYTKEDITEYISKNTILPYLFDAAAKKYPDGFNPDGAVWQLLKDNPDRYIYPAARKGIDLQLPETINAGIADVSQRQGWNRPADSDFALPTETWREHIARRQRCLELRQKLTTGEIHTINDLITYNLDIRQFAQDVIENCEDPDLLRAFYGALFYISILDPTCGSGAFLFAALTILEPLHQACLERMEAFLDDLARSGQKHSPKKFEDFRQRLEWASRSPNRKYFILKCIILHNLYGVDIMHEAVEICKLRLFLKLVAQVSPDPYSDNYGLDPLPDIDFNIRAGNTLVGFANYEETRKAVEGDTQKKLDLYGDMKQIDEKAENADRAFKLFHEMQLEHGMLAGEFREAKVEVRRRLGKLKQALDHYLAREYGVNVNKPEAVEQWAFSHQPFHWYVEFYGLIKQGGFDVIIGNPPYIELSKVRSIYSPVGFQTNSCGNLYALCMERSVNLLKNSAWLGFIVQQPLASTQRMETARNILLQKSSIVLCSTYDDRPSKLFDGIHHARIAITLSRKDKPSKNTQLYVTAYSKWYREERERLFQKLFYTKSTEHTILACFPKIRSSLESSIIRKISSSNYFREWLSGRYSNHRVYYKITGVGHWFTITKRPPKFFREGVESASTREQSISFEDSAMQSRAFCLLNSSLFYWFYQVRTNCRDFNPSDYKTFPLKKSLRTENFSDLAEKLEKSLDSSSGFINVTHSQTGSIQLEQFRPREAKLVIDEIDRVLAKHYDFTDEELDFIINYDIKYRLGRDSEEEDYQKSA